MSIFDTLDMFNYTIFSKLEGVESVGNFTPNFARALFLAKKDRVDFVYNTAALEGNAMTFPEVATLLEGVTVGGHKLSDEQQILNQNQSVHLLFAMLEKGTFALDHDTVCLLHHEVAKQEALTWGKFRDGDVNIGGTEYSPPQAKHLRAIFDEGIAELEKQEDIIVRAISYFLFGAINQFFYDGNKRTARLVMNGILISHGYPILNIKAKDRLEFNTKMIEFYDSKDIRPILDYLTHYYVLQNEKFLQNTHEKDLGSKG